MQLLFGVKTTDINIKVDRTLDLCQQLLPLLSVYMRSPVIASGQQLSCQVLAFLLLGLSVSVAGHENGQHRILSFLFHPADPRGVT